MTMFQSQQRFTMLQVARADQREMFASAVRDGLTATPKRLPCCYFYDDEGSRLFETICKLPEYYLTRAEHEILEAHAAELAAQFSSSPVLVEFGSGNSAKTQLLIEAFSRHHRRVKYVPIDICSEVLQETSLKLIRDYPQLEILAIAGEYDKALQELPASPGETKLILWLGSNLGNFHPADAVSFLQRIHRKMSINDRLLVGIDLAKERQVLELAYNDSQGVTARFNLNLLSHINRELGGHFDFRLFDHHAFYNQEASRIEMSLIAAKAHQVRIDGLNLVVSVDQGESIHTEDSYKFSLDQIQQLADRAGFVADFQWLDHEGHFSVNILAPLRTSC